MERTLSSQPKGENEPISEQKGSVFLRGRSVNVAVIGPNQKPKLTIGGARVLSKFTPIGGSEKDSSGPGTLKISLYFRDKSFSNNIST